jgi:hypothetical protein
MWWWLVRGFI